MNAFDFLSLLLVTLGCGFFVAGSVGMLRLPDALTRLHAVTKVDGAGLGLLIVGLMLQAESLYAVGKLMLVWMLVLLSSATTCHLIARSTFRVGTRAEPKP